MSEVLHDRVRLDATGPVGVVTLARPEAGNALDLAMGEALREAGQRLQAAAADGAVRSILVAAEGKIFCVGGDLREFSAVDDAGAHVARVADAAHGFLTALRESGVPVVVAVQGVAAGGGLGFALVGDVILAARSARFRVAYTAAGLSPDCGTSYRLGRALGPALAADLVLTNRPFDAADAERWGLVSRVVDDQALAATAAEVAGSLAAGSREALAQALRLVRAGQDRDWHTQLDDEAATISRLIVEPDGQEGVAAFLGKRSPVFG